MRHPSKGGIAPEAGIPEGEPGHRCYHTALDIAGGNQPAQPVFHENAVGGLFGIGIEAGEGEEIIYAELDSNILTDTRKRMPLLDQRNPSVYKF